MTELDRNIAKWYDDWHLAHGMDSWRGPDAYSHILAGLNARPGERLLDLGCGTGYFLKIADEAGLETFGVDVSEEAVRLSRKTSPRSNIFVCNMQKLNGIGPFDYVTALGSLEHCPSIDDALQEICRVLLPDGHVIILVPNSNYEGSVKSVQGEIIETRMTLSEWREVFDRNGFAVNNVGYEMVDDQEDFDRAYQFIFSLKPKEAV